MFSLHVFHCDIFTQVHVYFDRVNYPITFSCPSTIPIPVDPLPFLQGFYFFPPSFLFGGITYLIQLLAAALIKGQEQLNRG